MKDHPILTAVLSLSMLTLAGVIAYYYWSSNSFASLKYPPMYIMVLAFCYMLLQILKRYMISRKNKWDWLYYIGLATMMLPIFLMDDQSVFTFNLVNNIGIAFLIVPVLLDGKELMQRNQ